MLLKDETSLMDSLMVPAKRPSLLLRFSSGRDCHTVAPAHLPIVKEPVAKNTATKHRHSRMINVQPHESLAEAVAKSLLLKEETGERTGHRRPMQPLPPPPAKELRGCTCPKCKPILYQPPRHLRDDPMNIKQQGLGFMSHDPYVLATTAIASFDSITGLRRWGQIKALTEWRQWWRGGRSDAARLLRSGNLRDVDPRILHAPAEIFSQLFFLDSLHFGKLDITWSLTKDQGFLGLTCGVAKDEHPTPILLNPDHIYHQFNDDNLLCTLLHEMIHAYLGRYTCFGGPQSPCGSEQCAGLVAANYGMTPHGRAWQHLAKAIEGKMRRFLGLKGRLSREECMVKEVQWCSFRPCRAEITDLCDGFEDLVAKHMRPWYDDMDTSLVEKRRNKPRQKIAPHLRRRRSVHVCEGIATAMMIPK